MPNQITWAIQDNLGSSPEIPALFHACQQLGIPTRSFQAIPFSNHLPDVPTGDPTLFYGSARLIERVQESGRWSPGAFWSDEAFRFSSSLHHYGALMLNHDGNLGTLGEISNHPVCRDDDIVFLRPDRDLKEFSGQLASIKELKDWVENLGDSGTIQASTRVIVSTPKILHHEWRLFMVDGQFSSGSHYRRFGELAVHPEVPQEVIDFANSAAQRWQPAEAYAIDIGECQGELKIIELNGFNSTGFYASDIRSIVADITTMLE